LEEEEAEWERWYAVGGGAGDKKKACR